MNYSLTPITAPKPNILILGSMPGKESLDKQQYYAHPQNRFWKIMFAYFNLPYAVEYEQRINLLKENSLAVWDTIGSCRRENSSLDSKITEITCNDIGAFLEQNPTVKAVILNGKKAESVFLRHFSFFAAPKVIDRIALPSTSPANAAFSFEKLYEIWKMTLDKYFI